MSKRSDDLLLEDIIESALKIKRYKEGHTYESFSDDSKTIDAIIRNFEIIGEASNRLSSEFKEKHHQIEWYRIIGFRNRIIHDYMGVDLHIVWNISEDFLSELIKDLSNI